MSTKARYALYLAPQAGSALESLAAAWLGRDLAGQPVDPPAFAQALPDWVALTESPRHYGFHGTLKPPFSLAEGRSPDDLVAAAERLAATCTFFDIPRMEVAALGAFLALRPVTPEPKLNQLAATCVREIDAFRAPQSADELAKRRAKGLSARQEEMLSRWGYPYVFDEFRFHMTLTDPVEDATRRETLCRNLADYFAPALVSPVSVKEIALYRQPDRAAPFVLVRRFPFGDDKR